MDFRRFRMPAWPGAALPVTGEWEPETLAGLLERLHAVAVTIVADLDTAELGASDTPVRALTDYLDTGVPPLWTSRWRDGRFVGISGTLKGTEGVLVSLVDPELTELGEQAQPVDWVAAAVRGRGLWLVVEDAAAARAIVLAAGLRAEAWRV
ncbi:hypothetical protein AB5J62_27290 [Amycolatopsis sp. cg5]|uniref:DUF6885 family protein n=1 Tax=Amycolatopsis sp. cg5 TaxID=3238802 RepID=UPI003524BDB0